MNLRQAYDGWSQQEQNRQLYVNTRDAFRRAWFTLPTNKLCSWYTKDVLALALAETRVVESDKVKAASVMIHVLTWANFAEPKYNPKPDFEIKDVTRLIHLPADKLEKERQCIMAAQQALPEAEETDDKPTATGEPTATPDNDADPLDGIDFDDKKQVADALMEQSARIMNDKPENNETNMEKEKKPRGKQPRQICQIDPDTLQVVKTYDSCTEGCRTVGVKNLDRAIKRLQKSGGFYWQYPDDVSTFADRLKQKQDGQQQPKSKPKAKKVSRGLMDKFMEEHEQFKEHQAVEHPDSPKFHIGDRVCNMLPQFAGMVGTVETEGEWLGRTYGYVVKIDNASYKMLESEMMPAPAEQPVVETFTPEPLSTFTDEELMEELDRRGFEGELSRRVVFTIGAK